MRRCLTVLVAMVASIAAGLTLPAGSAAADPPAPPGTPTANAFDGIPTVGPIFRGAVSGRHSCTGSVLSSPGHDVPFSCRLRGSHRV
jgi:hypothetical protein